MDSRTWYLGPLGGLRPLDTPDGGVERTVTRYGGVHQALSGARTMDITGHRASYTLSVPTITPDESRYMEALHLRTVPGPFYLLDPLGRNRLSRDAALLKPHTGEVRVTSGGAQRLPTGPDVGVPVTGLSWSSFGDDAVLTVPPVPVVAGETLTTSVFARTDGAAELVLVVTVRDADRDVVDTVPRPIVPDGTWQRHAITTTIPDDAATVDVTIRARSGNRVFLAAMQVENTSEPGEWEPGGAAPTVVIDQLERNSPRFPFNDLEITLLEV